MPDSVYRADFGPLSALLREQLAQYQKLLKMAEDKRECLISVNVEKLNVLVNAETKQLKQLAALEKKRLEATEKLAAELGLKGPQTLTDLLAYAAQTEQAALTELRDGFAALAQSLVEVNNTNRLLLQTNMQLNDLMLDLISEPEDPLNNFYGADGNEAEEKLSSPSIFDQQI